MQVTPLFEPVCDKGNSLWWHHPTTPWWQPSLLCSAIPTVVCNGCCLVLSQQDHHAQAICCCFGGKFIGKPDQWGILAELSLTTTSSLRSKWLLISWPSWGNEPLGGLIHGQVVCFSPFWWIWYGISQVTSSTRRLSVQQNQHIMALITIKLWWIKLQMKYMYFNLFTWNFGFPEDSYIDQICIPNT